MLRVPMVQARPGMTLAVPIIHPEHPDTVLLREGFTLDDLSIARLREINLAELWIEYPGLEFINKHICPEILQRRGIIAYEVRRMLDRMSTHSGAELDYGHYRSTIRDFVRTLNDRPSAAFMIESMIQGDRSLMRHASDVCYLALLLGMKLETYLILQRKRLPGHRAKGVVNLGIAAMLHDVGMLALERDVIDDWIAHGCDESHPEWRKHVLIGHERVREQLAASANAAILHHHQHFDGTGFPLRRDKEGLVRGLRGEEIHVFARILMVADLFDRLSHPPGRTTNVPHVRVLRQMQQHPYAEWMDPVVFRALLAVAPAYAPGTQVRLSTGERGVVVEWSAQDPCRPVVQLFARSREDFDRDPIRIDLSLVRDRVIVEANGANVADDNFFPAYEGQFDLFHQTGLCTEPLHGGREAA